MAFFLFVDESGQDHRDSPYEVLAGVAVEDRDLWNLIEALRGSELAMFGRRYTAGSGELKGKKILKRKVFRHAEQLPLLEPVERRELAKKCLDSGSTANRREITALAQAKIAFVREVLGLCVRFRCRAFASIVDPKAPRPGYHALRKDYAYLFERFFYFLEDAGPHHQGVVVFDELEKAQSHILLDQMEEYFQQTARGRLRAAQIIPEAFFVHSDLSSLVQVADLVAYILSWGYRLPSMKTPARRELEEFADLLQDLRHMTRREVDGNPDFVVYSFTYIADLRGRDERD